MNAQTKFLPEPHRTAEGERIVVSRGIEWCSIFGPGSGYTSNPIRGCEHDCHWKIGDVVVECYAQAFRDRLDGKGAFKKITFHPEELERIKKHKQPAGIFVDSMSDLCGNGVKAEWIEAVLATMRACQQHIFFVLTKNPRRITEFEWPDNALVGISAPPTFMYGKELSEDQQQVWFARGMEWLARSKAKNIWVSLEPLVAQVVESLAHYPRGLTWAVIGAGSDGRKTYQPDEKLFSKTLAVLKCPVFFKGNLDRALAERHGGWREEFPDMNTQQESKTE